MGIVTGGSYLLSVDAFSTPVHHLQCFRKNVNVKLPTAIVPSVQVLPLPQLDRESRITTCTSISLYGKQKTSDVDGEDDDTLMDSFDAQGFGGYLAPYALTVVASIVVTAAFFKFVLLDY